LIAVILYCYLLTASKRYKIR